MNCLAVSGAQASKRLVLLNWSEYIEPSVLEAFTNETGIRVDTVHYEDIAERDSMLALSKPGEFDVVVMSSDRVPPMIEAGWLAPISATEVPLLSNVNRAWFETVPGSWGYTAPYARGTLGVAYRSDLLKTPVTGWEQIFYPDAELCDNLWMMPDPRENIGLAQLYLRHSSEAVDLLNDSHTAHALLLEQMECVQDYDYPYLDERADIVKGKVAAVVIYSREGIILSEAHPAIEFTHPDELTLGWTEFLIIPQSSQRKKSAYAFLNFMNQPAIAARNADFLYFVSPVNGAPQLQERTAERYPQLWNPQGLTIIQDVNFPTSQLRSINHMAMELKRAQEAR